MLGARPPAGSPGRAILVQHYRDRLPLALYLPGLKWMNRPAEVSELDVVSFSSPRSSGFCWWGSACNLWASTMQATYSIRGFQAASRRRIHQFTVLRLVAPSGMALSTDMVASALRTTSFRNDELLVQR